jgi:hypothetical protein
MNIRFITKYQVITVKGKMVVRNNFDSWTVAYHWSLKVDDGHFDEYGGLRVTAYEIRA